MSEELYKTYRPSKWSNFIGQNAVVRSLMTLVERATVKGVEEIPGALLFSGPRGCGKTSAAFVLTKALNCPNVSADTRWSPCNECETCKRVESGFTNGTVPGVRYLSMANAQGVESIRSLTNEAKLESGLRKSVFIVDEIHNCSPAAFDALLIPLEEKHSPTLFILCTTAPEKVPATILSRVQQRRFSLVSTDNMELYLRSLVKTAKLQVDDATLKKAMRLGRGSVRDTLTHLDSLLAGSFENEQVNDEFFSGLVKGDLVACLGAISKATRTGTPVRDLFIDLFTDVKNVYLWVNGVKDVVLPVDEEQLEVLGEPKLIDLLFREFSQTAYALARGLSTEVILDALAVRSVNLVRKFR